MGRQQPGDAKDLKLEDLYVDLGLPADAVKERVKVGDMVTLDRDLTEVGDTVETQNVITDGFRANTDGDSFIHARIELPNPCVAPIVMILAGSEDKWFAVTGFEAEEDD